MNDLHTSSFRHRIPFPSFCGRLLLSETIMETGEPPPKHLETDQQIVYRCLEELRRAGFSIPSSAIERIQSGVHTTDFQLTLHTQLPTKMAAASPQPVMTHLSCADIPLAIGEDEGSGGFTVIGNSNLAGKYQICNIYVQLQALNPEFDDPELQSSSIDPIRSVIGRSLTIKSIFFFLSAWRFTSACCTGFRKNSSAPSSKHRSILAGTSSDDMITTGISFNEEHPFTFLRSSYPVIPGIL
nr:hypothetical protein Iba_chr09bCG2100 [Ipomoea batatas]